MIKKGDAIGWNTEKIFKPNFGIVSDLVSKENNLFIATIPDYVWTKIE
ncbi:hypothetical protein [Paenibacillus albiflavus]|nr:hypothetical protein [Paenibacillus albiflavus]